MARWAPAWIRPIAEGWSLLLPLGVAAAALLRRWPLASAALGGAAAAIAWALRDPERQIVPGPTWLAPADGRVVSVAAVEDPWVGAAWEIAIFLALWNVHVQRMPYAARIARIEAVAGGFRPAFLAGAATNNRQILSCETEHGRAVLVLISGIVARRIVLWVSPGDRLARGERLGMIKFGSRVTLRIPRAFTPLVRPGDAVRAGLTPIARPS